MTQARSDGGDDYFGLWTDFPSQLTRSEKEDELGNAIAEGLSV